MRSREPVGTSGTVVEIVGPCAPVMEEGPCSTVGEDGADEGGGPRPGTMCTFLHRLLTLFNFLSSRAFLYKSKHDFRYSTDKRR